MCTIAESEKKIYIYIYIYILFGWLIKIIHLPFFFSCLSLSLSHLSSWLSQLWSHSLNSDHRSTKLNSSSLSQLQSPTHEARRRLECLTGKPMELTADRSACLWILVLSCCQWFVSRRRSEIWFFFFLLWTGGGGGGGGGVDGGCGCGCIWW